MRPYFIYILLSFNILIFTNITYAQSSCSAFLRVKEHTQNQKLLTAESRTGVDYIDSRLLALEKVETFDQFISNLGWDVFSLKASYESAQSKDKTKIIHFIDQLYSSPSKRTAQKTLQKLYLLSQKIHNTGNRGINLSISQFIQEKSNKIAQTRIDQAFINNTVTGAMIEMGIVKSGTKIENIRAKIEEYRNIQRLLISASINSAALFYLGIPVHVPKLEANSGISIPNTIIERIRKFGLASVKSELKNLYSVPGQFYLYWGAIRRSYVAAFTVFSLFILFESYPMMKYSILSKFTSEQRIEALQRETFNPTKIRIQQLENWKEAYIVFEGAEPSRGELQEQWSRLLLIPDKDFKIDFSNE